MGRGKSRRGTQGDLGRDPGAAGRRPLRAYAGGEDPRHHRRVARRCRRGLRQGRSCGGLGLPLSLSEPRAVRAQLRGGRRHAGQRPGDVVDAGCLQRPQISGRCARHEAPTGAHAIPRRLGHLRAKLLRRCRTDRRTSLAGGRPAGARSVHALGRTRLGPVRSRAPRRGPCRRRCRRQARRLRI